MTTAAKTETAARASMGEIRFTQFMRPSGRPVPVSINRPLEIAQLANALAERGYRFECEHLSTGEISLTISDDEADHEIEIVKNGPDVPDAIDRMIRRFAALAKVQS